jgi:acyl-CoA thioester hydrolase
VIATATSPGAQQDGEGYLLTGLGVVHPWLCDAMGHLTTRFYTAFFDDASWHLFAELGYVEATARAEGWGWADVVTTTEYKGEIGAGGLIRVKSRIIAIGNSSLTAEHLLCERSSGAVCARMEAKTVCFDLVARRSRPLPDSIRAAATGMLSAAAS